MNVRIFADGVSRAERAVCEPLHTRPQKDGLKQDAFDLIERDLVVAAVVDRIGVERIGLYQNKVLEEKVAD
jgi:hypothetical protein